MPTESKNSNIDTILTNLKNAKSTTATGLISVLIPADYNIWLVISKLKTEISTASNIQDKNNKKNVIIALKMIIKRLQSISDKTHIKSNGIALYTGSNYYV